MNIKIKKLHPKIKFKEIDKLKEKYKKEIILSTNF